MKRIIFKFWLINILISLALFITYRIVIAGPDHAEENFFKWVLQILDILLNLAYSFVYLIAMVFCSLAIFLNLTDRIRNNLYLSLLTFLGIPLFCVIFIIISIVTDGLFDHNTVTVFRNILIFSVIYLFFTTVEFFIFRKTIKTFRLNE